MTSKTAAATAARRRIGLETMAAKLAAAGYDLRPPPACPTDRAFLQVADDAWICPVCGDEFDIDTAETMRGGKR